MQLYMLPFCTEHRGQALIFNSSPLHRHPQRLILRTRNHREGRRRSACRKTVCLGGNIFSTIFRRDTDEAVAELDIAEAVDEAALAQGDVTVLQEAVSESTGERTQIIFKRNAEIGSADLLDLIEKVGWPKRPVKKLETALRGSYLVSTVVQQVSDAEGTLLREQLMGLVRCTSDRVFNATIWDVLVDPQYQGNGIGRYMVVRTVQALKAEQIGNICLFADAEVVGFYEQLGFKADPDGVRGMFWDQR